MFPNDELTPFDPGERKALEAGDVPDEPDTYNRCGEDLSEGESDLCLRCLDEYDEEIEEE